MLRRTPNLAFARHDLRPRPRSRPGRSAEGRLAEDHGELWINSHDTKHGRKCGTGKNDELLGGHGDDRGDDDILYVSKTQNRKVKRRNCERVLHRSAQDAVHDRDGL